MLDISYKLSCRNCFQQDGLQQVIYISDLEEIDSVGKSDYEIMLIIEDIRLRRNDTCQFCNSNNVEILDINIGINKVYDFEEIYKRNKKSGWNMVMFNLNKDISGEKYTRGGDSFISEDLMKKALCKTFEIIKERPADNFNPLLKGMFFICFSEKENEPELIVEKFRTVGLSKQDIYSKLKGLSRFYGLDLIFNDIEFYNLDSNIKIFNGGSFNKWFYNKDSVLNSCFATVYLNLDIDTIVAVGTEQLSPVDFIEKNQNVLFMIDTNESVMYDNKKVYLAKLFTDK